MVTGKRKKEEKFREILCYTELFSVLISLVLNFVPFTLSLCSILFFYSEIRSAVRQSNNEVVLDLS